MLTCISKTHSITTSMWRLQYVWRQCPSHTVRNTNLQNGSSNAQGFLITVQKSNVHTFLSNKYKYDPKVGILCNWNSIRWYSGKTHYEVLGVRRGATNQEIKTAYLQLCKKYHPDSNSSQEAKIKFQAVKNAYDALSNNLERRKHDESLKTGHHVHAQPRHSHYGQGSSYRQSKHKHAQQTKQKPEDFYSKSFYSNAFHSYEENEKDERREKNLDRKFVVKVMALICILIALGKMYSSFSDKRQKELVADTEHLIPKVKDRKNVVKSSEKSQNRDSNLLLNRSVAIPQGKQASGIRDRSELQSDNLESDFQEECDDGTIPQSVYFLKTKVKHLNKKIQGLQMDIKNLRQRNKKLELDKQNLVSAREEELQFENEYLKEKIKRLEQDKHNLISDANKNLIMRT